MYQGPEGTAYVHFYEGQPVIHSELPETVTTSILKGVKTVSKQIEEAFKEKGFTELITWAETEEQDKYNLFLGYEQIGIVDSMPENYPNEVRKYRKVL